MGMTAVNSMPTNIRVPRIEDTPLLRLYIVHAVCTVLPPAIHFDGNLIPLLKGVSSERYIYFSVVSGGDLCAHDASAVSVIDVDIHDYFDTAVVVHPDGKSVTVTAIRHPFNDEALSYLINQTKSIVNIVFCNYG